MRRVLCHATIVLGSVYKARTHIRQCKYPMKSLHLILLAIAANASSSEKSGSSNSGNRNQTASEGSKNSGRIQSFKDALKDSGLMEKFEGKGDKLMGSKHNLDFAKSGKQITIVSKKTDGTVSRLKFGITPQPRMGIEWHHSDDLEQGTAVADIAYATRLMGMYEVNSTFPSWVITIN